MKTSDFDYNLPPELIAQNPAAKRDESRMLVLDRSKTELSHEQFPAIINYLRAGDLLVVNDTRVFPARIKGEWADTHGRVEMLLLEPQAADSEAPTWQALCGSGRPVRRGQIATFGGGALNAEVIEVREEGRIIVRFNEPELFSLLEKIGETPLPPYIRRKKSSACEEDKERYQTIYAREIGSCAAPTAGLHFTPAVMAALREKGVERAQVTLHVGLGTFRPVAAENVEEHVMHSERFSISQETADALNACRARGGRVVAVGSTTVRTLETMGAMNGGAEAFACRGRSDIFIRDDFKFHWTDAMLTNFHLPRSTLLMMICALAGHDRVLAAYNEAVAMKYRFFSFGDCMLIV